MHFSLIDRVLESGPDRLVAIKLVSSAEEYLQDHFATFPVLPGVLMLEAMVQAARELVERESAAHNAAHAALSSRPPHPPRLVLGSVRALKYGSFVPPGSTLRVEVERTKALDQGVVEFKGIGKVLHPTSTAASDAKQMADIDPPTAVSGRFTLRPVRVD